MIFETCCLRFDAHDVDDNEVSPTFSPVRNNEGTADFLNLF
jgi:hypothetical protein